MTNPRPNPYPGPRSFQRGEKLYGRELETAELLDLLIAERIVLLSSPSGAGKTSLVQASLIPVLEAEGFRVLPVMRPGLPDPRRGDPSVVAPAPVAQGGHGDTAPTVVEQGGHGDIGVLREGTALTAAAPANRYTLSLLLSLERELPEAEHTPLAELASTSLAGYLDHLPTSPEEGRRGDVLIFDQFEEVLTVDPTDRDAKLAFFEQLGQALRVRNRWALFCMREEFVASLDPYLRPIPARFDKGRRYRLDLLGPDAAREAMQRPPADQDPAVALIARAIADAQQHGELPAFDVPLIKLGRPKGSAPGEYTCSAAIESERAADRAPLTIAQAIVSRIGQSDFLVGAQVASNGLIHLRLDERRLADHPRVTFTDAAARKLADDLRRAHVQQPDGTTAATLGQYIEPVQLQVVCRRLWDGLTPDDMTVGLDDLAAVGDVDTALRSYYADTVKAVGERAGVRERAIREWFDRQLITEAGIRGQVLKGCERSPDGNDGLDNAAVKRLEDAHLVRSEQRRGATWFELAHDRLIAPVRADNAAWFKAHLSTLQRRAALWEDQKRPDGLLLQGEPLAEAEEWAAAQTEPLEPREMDFLDASQKARVRAEREQRQNRRIRRLAVGLAIITVIAVVASILAGLNTIRANRQSELARSRELAAAAVTNLNQDPELSLLLAQQAIDTTHTTEGEDALRRGLQTARVIERFTMGSQGIQRAAFSPNGLYLAAVTEDGRVQMWQRPQPITEFSMSGASESPPRTSDSSSDARGYDLAYSPDGELLATAHGDGTARLWDARTGEQRAELAATLSKRLPGVYSVAFSRDGHTLATGGQDRIVRLWNVDQPQQPAQELIGHRGDILDIVFASAATQIATASADGTVKIWDSATGAELQTWQAHDEPVYAVDISPDGRLLATGSQDKTAVIWDVSGSQPEKLQTLFDHTNSISDVSFSPNGACLATASADRTAKLWDAKTGQLLLNLPGFGGWVTSVAFDPSEESDTDSNSPSRCGKRLTTSSLDGVVRLWNIGPNHEGRLFLGHEGPVESAVFSPDGRQAATAGDDGTARLWDVETGRQLLELPQRKKRINRVAYSPDGNVVATASWDGTAELYDRNSGELLASLIEPSGQAVHSIAFSHDGKVATASESGNVTLWDAATGQPLRTWPHHGRMYGVAFSPDGTRLAATESDGQIHVYAVAGGELQLSLAQGALTVYDAAFSPDGKLLATVSWDGTAQLWGMPSGEPVRTLRGHSDRLYGVQFSPDGRSLATSSADHTTRLWDVATGGIVQTLPGPEFNSLQFSPDGRALIVGGEDGTARIYTLELSELLAAARNRLTRTWTKDECLQYLHTDQCPTAAVTN